MESNGEQGDLVFVLGVSGFQYVEYKITDYCENGEMIVENKNYARRIQRSDVKLVVPWKDMKEYKVIDSCVYKNSTLLLNCLV